MGREIKHVQRDNVYLTQCLSLISCTAHVITCVWQQQLLFEIQ